MQKDRELKQVTTIEELNTYMSGVLQQLETDPRQLLLAREKANIAGKIQTGVKLVCLAAMSRGQEPVSPWIPDEKGPPLKPTAKLLG